MAVKVTTAQLQEQVDALVISVIESATTIAFLKRKNRQMGITVFLLTLLLGISVIALYRITQ